MNRLALSFGSMAVFATLSIPFVPDDWLPVMVGLVCIGSVACLLFQDTGP